MIRINNSVSIPEDELVITAARSSGPGGQNVNKVATKVTLRFSVSGTAHLSGMQKERVFNKLKNQISREGDLVIHEETHRSQAANRKRVIEKFRELIARALIVPKKRVPTKISRSQKKKRLEDKRIHSETKTRRRREPEPD